MNVSQFFFAFFSEMPSDLAVATAGAVSAAFSTASVYPLDTVKTYLNKGERMHAIIARLNFFEYYSGIRAKILMSMTQKFLYFYIYNYLKRSNWFRSSSFRSLIIGYLSAIFAVGLLTPLEVAQTRQQLGANSSIFQILRQIYSQDGGIKGWYKGIGTNIILCINPAIEFTVFENLRSKILANRPHLSDAQAFSVGAAAKAVATVTTFPLVRAKVLQQTSKGSKSFGDILINLITVDGYTSWFAGMQTQLVKNVIASALMLAMKERIERTMLLAMKQ